MEHDFERVTELIVAADPSAAVERLLRYVCERHGASGGAVLALRGEDQVALAVRSLELDRFDFFVRLWKAHEQTLRAGRLLGDQTHALVPLVDRGNVVGVLFLDGPAPLETDALNPFLAALAKALRAATGEASPALDQGTLLERILERHEWNVARAARELRVTRRTVYMRMQRFGITRQRVPKVLKRA